MEDNIFQLDTNRLKDIAHTLENRIKEGLNEYNREILCIPTYINPNTQLGNEKALVLDLGGTNFRVAIVEFVNGEAVIHPKNGLKAKFDELMKRPDEKACEREELYKAIADIVGMLDLKGIKNIGYCFSYPCENTPEGDAILIKWTKGVTVKGMVVEDIANAKKEDYIGYSLMKYLNDHIKGAEFTTIKVINDTVAALFSGLTDTEAQAHIGLIVGTGTNMATFFPENKIEKLNVNKPGLIPVNLESGNFRPPYLNVIDNKIDKYSGSCGTQRFEKAISGMYLGRILEYLFSSDDFEENFDAQELTKIMSYPDRYKETYVHAAHLVYERSAKLVAASLAGLILEQIATYSTPISKVRLAAEGGLFWSEDSKSCSNCRRFTPYKDIVMDELDVLLKALSYKDVKVYTEQKENANLIGSAIAALS